MCGWRRGRFCWFWLPLREKADFLWKLWFLESPSETVSGRDRVLLDDNVKNYRSVYLLACKQLISDPFPWKRMGLARLGSGGEKQRFRAKQGAKIKSGWRPGWQAPGWPEARWLESQEHQEHPKNPERESFVLKTYTVGGIGEKTVRYWLMGKCSASFPGGHDYPNLGMCGGLDPKMESVTSCSRFHLFILLWNRYMMGGS